MDYTIASQAEPTGRRWTVTALTERALVRTPERLIFEDRTEALQFLRDSQSAGFRFAGVSLIDPEQKMVKNRYFVIRGDGELAFAGEDNGPLDTVWELGDVMPGRNRDTGPEALIESILSGPAPRERFGCDLAFILRLHHPVPGSPVVPAIQAFDAAKSCPCGLYGKTYGACCRDRGLHSPGNEMLQGTSQGWFRELSQNFSPAWFKEIPDSDCLEQNLVLPTA